MFVFCVKICNFKKNKINLEKNYICVSVVPVKLVADNVFGTDRGFVPLEGDFGFVDVDCIQVFRLTWDALLRLDLDWRTEWSRADTGQRLNPNGVDGQGLQVRDRRQLTVVHRLELPV